MCVIKARAHTVLTIICDDYERRGGDVSCKLFCFATLDFIYLFFYVLHLSFFFLSLTTLVLHVFYLSIVQQQF